MARLWSDDGLLGSPHMRVDWGKQRLAFVYCDIVLPSCVRSVSAERRVDVLTLWRRLRNWSDLVCRTCAVCDLTFSLYVQSKEYWHYSINIILQTLGRLFYCIATYVQLLHFFIMIYSIKCCIYVLFCMHNESILAFTDENGLKCEIIIRLLTT